MHVSAPVSAFPRFVWRFAWLWLLLGAVAWLLAGGWPSPLAQAFAQASDAAAPSAHTALPAAGLPRPALVVHSVRAQAGPVAQHLLAYGDITPWQEASVSSEASGLRVVALLADVGQTVRAGQVLARLESDTVRAALAQAEAGLREADVAADEAQRNAERANALHASGAMSPQQIDQYRTNAAMAQARRQSAQAALHSQQLRLRQTEVRAPDAGILSQRSASLGAVPAPGTELFRLLRQGRLEWRAQVSAEALAQLTPGMAVQVRSSDGSEVAARVRLLAPTVDAQTRRALVYVDLPPHPGLRAGQFAQGRFELPSQPGLRVPLSAVVLRDGFSHVLALRPLAAEDGSKADQASGASSTSGAEAADLRRVQLRRIETGAQQGDWVQVRQGLDAETPLVARGGAFLNEGDVVRVLPEEYRQKPPETPAGKAPIAIQ